MTVRDIAYKIVDLANQGDHPFSKIQEVRYKHGKSPRSWKPFAEYSIKERYAFHAGGRKELQFNIGLQEWGEDEVFRYGVAFSLQQDNTLHNPKAEFRDAVKRFNKFLADHPAFFKGYKMWYYKNHEFAESFDQVIKIDKALFQAENFIFIGNFFNKRIDHLTESDLKKIVSSFDYLMYLYEKVQFGDASIENRISRLCWNSNGWVLPSGPLGKSKNKDTHEGKYGYGHEEWFFDISKTIDGYHYGFLEPIRKQQDAYEDKIFNVWLYTIDSVTKRRYWVGEIKNLEVLDRTIAAEAWRTYKKKGWLKEMELQIQASGANTRGFSDWKGVDLFNVRFLPLNLKTNEPIIEFAAGHPIYKLSRYAFAFFNEHFNMPNAHPNGFSFISKDNPDENDLGDGPEVRGHLREPKAVEIVYLHNKISKRLTKYLKDKYGKKNVTREHPAGRTACKIDIVTNVKGDLTFYEIKTYTSLTASIREALGQLFEYSFYPDTNKAKKLVIVTQPHNDYDEAKKYLKYLRDLFNLNIYYQYFDWENNFLSDEF